jgi:hypothetical protein
MWFSTFSLALKLGKPEDLLPSQIAQQIIAVAAHHDHDWSNALLCLQGFFFCRLLIRSDRRKTNQTRSGHD